MKIAYVIMEQCDTRLEEPIKVLLNPLDVPYVLDALRDADANRATKSITFDSSYWCVPVPLDE